MLLKYTEKMQKKKYISSLIFSVAQISKTDILRINDSSEKTTAKWDGPILDTDDLFGYLRGDTRQNQVESKDSCSHCQSKASLRYGNRGGGGTDGGVILHVL